MLIGSAMGTNPAVIKNYKGTEPYIDYLLLMTYDYSGSWGDGGHLAPLYASGNMDPQFNCDAALRNTLDIGYPVNKIVMGLPLYGRGWKKIVPKDPSAPIFGTSVAGPADSFSGSAGEPGLSSWRHIKPIIGTNGFVQYFDQTAQATYIASPTGEVWSFDDESTIKIKTTYAMNKNLIGIMFWELSDDVRTGNGLVSSAIQVINNLDSNIKGEIKGEPKGDKGEPKGDKGELGGDKGELKGDKGDKDNSKKITITIENFKDEPIVINSGEKMIFIVENV